MEDLRALVSGFSLSRARLAAAAGVSEAAIKKLTKKELAPALTAENEIDLGLAFGIMLGLDDHGNATGKNRTKTSSPKNSPAICFVNGFSPSLPTPPIR